MRPLVVQVRHLGQEVFGRGIAQAVSRAETVILVDSMGNVRVLKGDPKIVNAVDKEDA